MRFEHEQRGSVGCFGSKHVQRIDVLRALAILMVICFHALEAMTGKGSLPWTGDFRSYDAAPDSAFLSFYIFTFGWLGVVLFFVISGFCIHLSFLKWEQKAPAKKGLQEFIRQFYFRRFWRIYPVYLLALAFFTCLRVTNLWTWKGIKMVALHAALLHNFNPGHFFAINAAFWSIAVEWQLYLVYPLVILCRRYAGATSTFIGLGVFALLYRTYAPIITASENWQFALSQMPFSYWPQWLIGGWIAERWVARRAPIPNLRIWIYLAIIAFVVTDQYRPASRFSVDTAMVLFALIIEAFLRDPRPLTRFEKLLIPVGLSSYSIYLFHGLMYEMFSWMHEHIYRTRPYLDLSVTLTGIFLIILLPCWLSYRFLELGSVRIGNLLWDRITIRGPDETGTFAPVSGAEARAAEQAL
jgi:peptidoglycan/LPS O-acetylase OafA/YrhL